MTAARVALLIVGVCGSGENDGSTRLSLSGGTTSCYCSGIDYLQDYEHWPKNDAGGGCVGGCSGEGFYYHEREGVLKSLTVWYDTKIDKNSGIKAIRLEYFNSLQTHVFGHPEYGPSSQNIRFKPGETIVGDVTLSGNGFGSRLGYIAFSTSAGQNFAAGQNSHTKYLFPSGNSFISGVAGRSGADIDALAFIFWKPLSGLTYLDISYPSLDSLAKIKSPTVVTSFEYCNDNDVDRSFGSSSEEVKETTGSDSCFTASFSEKIGASLTVKASIPELADVEAETHWELSASQEFKNCQQHSKTTTRTVNFPSLTLAAHKRTQYQYTQWQGTLNSLPFTAKLRMTFTDRSTYETTESGTYDGAAYMSIQQSWTGEETGVTSCQAAVTGNRTVLV